MRHDEQRVDVYRTAFDAVVRDERYRQNLDWGRPRTGHPEGSIRNHIAELERNLEAFRDRVDTATYWKLKLLVHVHDTFKPDAVEGVPIAAPNSHASLARRFLAEFVDDEQLLTLVQYHDEPYALFQQSQRRGRLDRRRFDALLERIQDWDLFLAFLIIDGSTAGKSRRPLRWWFEQIGGSVTSRFGAADIL